MLYEDNVEIGKNLKHLTETLGMASCWERYSTKDPKCKECQVSAECRDNTKKKADSEVNEFEGEVKKSCKGKKAKKNVTMTIGERTNTLMNNAGFDCIEIIDNDTSTATMYKYERGSDSVNIIFTNTNRVKIICNSGDFVIDDIKEPQYIIDKVEEVCVNED